MHFQSRSPSIPTTTRPMTIHQEQISLTIHRASNTGLGISIAGGAGSTAFKDNDYVRIFSSEIDFIDLYVFREYF